MPKHADKISSNLPIKFQRYCLHFILWRIIRRCSRSGFDDIKSSYFENKLLRKTEKVITRTHVRYLKLTEFLLIPRDRLQKTAVFKLLA